MSRGNMHLKCPTGTHLDIRHAQYGMINSEFDNYDQCTQQAVDDELGLQNDATNCSSYVDFEKVGSHLKKHC